MIAVPALRRLSVGIVGVVGVAVVVLVAVGPLSSCVGPLIEEAAVGPTRRDVDVDPGCTTNGCLRGILHLVDVSRSELEALVEPGVDVDNGYAVWTIAYVTGGRAATATLTTPLGVSPPPGGFPIVVNNHGTVGLDDPCRLSLTPSGAALAGLFGARGSLGVAPDHPGLGTEGLQPYLIADVTGRSALDAVRAAIAAAAVQGVPTDGRAAIVGMSQGGHAALAAAAEHDAYAPELDVRAFAAAAPASMFLSHWQAGAAVDGPHLIFHALLAEAWADAEDADADDVFAPTFDRGLLRRTCLFDPWLRDDMTVLADVVPTSSSELFQPAFRQAFASGALSAWPFLERGFADNRLRPLRARAPVAIFQGDADEVILPAQTRELVSALEAGGVPVELIEVSGGTHVDTAFGFLGRVEAGTAVSVAWVKAALDL